MSQIRNKRRNNVLAGIFVTIALLLGATVMGTLTDVWGNLFRSDISYQVRFPIKTGIGPLTVGSAVRLGGVLIGSVTSVEPRASGNSPISEIEVQFKIDERFTLYENVKIQAKASLLGSTAWLAITDIGSGTIAKSTTELHGTVDSMVAQFLGTEAEINIGKSIESLQIISEALSKEGGGLDMLLGSEEAQTLKDAIASVKQGLAAIDLILSSTQSIWPTWQESITSILEDSTELPNQLSETLQEVQTVLHDVRTNILPNVERSVISFKKSMDVLESLSKKYQESEPRWVKMIDNILDNVHMMSSSAKRAMDTISASPWKLIYRPKDREIAYEQLNAASWQLLNALSDLRQSAEALQLAALSPDAPKEAALLAESLARSEAEFESARQAIRERMKLYFPQR